jgi:hypothetical protein
MKFDMLLARMVCVFVRVNRMTVGDVCMVGGSFVIAFLHLLGSGSMVLRCLFVVFSGEFVQFS